VPRAASLALVGFMGAGKSAVGMGVAHRRALPFVDSDAVIEEQMGPIAEIFALQGEARFRAVERDVCTAVLARAAAIPMVVSLGGGAVLAGDVRAALRELPHVAWLTAPPDVLWARAGEADDTGEAAVRPLARDRAAFEVLLAAREPLYREVATAIVDTGAGRTVDEVVEELVRLTDPAAARPCPRSATGRGEPSATEHADPSARGRAEPSATEQAEPSATGHADLTATGHADLAATEQPDASATERTDAPAARRTDPAGERPGEA